MYVVVVVGLQDVQCLLYVLYVVDCFLYLWVEILYVQVGVVEVQLCQYGDIVGIDEVWVEFD